MSSQLVSSAREKRVKNKFSKVERHILLHEASGIYYVRRTFCKQGLPELFVTTHERTLKRARHVADELILKHIQRAKESEERKNVEVRRSLATVIDEVLLTVTPLKRVGTQKQHKLILRELRRELGEVLIDDLTLLGWSKWLKEFRTRKTRTTFFDYQKHMNLVLRYAYKQRYTLHLTVLPNPDGMKANTGRVYSKDEITGLWNAMSEDLRDQFVLSYECYMRLREVLHLSWDRVDLSSGFITLRASDVKTGSKTGRGRVFKASALAIERLRVRHADRNDSPYVFPAPQSLKFPANQNKTAWQQAKKKAGIKGRARWHDLRHTGLSHALLDAKVNIVLLSEYAGVSVRTLQRVYLHSTAEKTAEIAGQISILK